MHAPMPQLPPLHMAPACAKAQTLPHTPQLFASEPSCASQPSLAVLLQSLNPGSHVSIAHPPPVHLEVACASMHAVWQLPQCCGSFEVVVSQPFALLPSQSPKPVL